MSPTTYYTHQRRQCWRAAVVGALMARRAERLEERLRWEDLALESLRRWVRWGELIVTKGDHK